MSATTGYRPSRSICPGSKRGAPSGAPSLSAVAACAANVVVGKLAMMVICSPVLRLLLILRTLQGTPPSVPRADTVVGSASPRSHIYNPAIHNPKHMAKFWPRPGWRGEAASFAKYPTWCGWQSWQSGHGISHTTALVFAPANSPRFALRMRRRPSWAMTLAALSMVRSAWPFACNAAITVPLSVGLPGDI